MIERRSVFTRWIGAALCAVPVIFALMRLNGCGYIYSALTSFACAVVVLLTGGEGRCGGWLLAAGLLLSVIGDYYLAHQWGQSSRFIIGVACFLAGHVMFILHAARSVRFSRAAAAAAGCIALFYAVYTGCRVLPGTPPVLRTPVALYALVSVASLSVALFTRRPLWMIGVALLVFSDTMIAEGDFLHTPGAASLIHPAYYASHVCMALSAVFTKKERPGVRQ